MSANIPRQPNVTFDEAQTAQKSFNDSFVISALNDRLESAPGRKEHFVKSYLDNIPADESDREFDAHPDRIIAYRDELSDFIADRLKFFVPEGALTPQEKDGLRALKGRFTQKLDADKKVVADFVTRHKSGEDVKYPHGAFGFHGMTIGTTDGKRIDLLTDAPQGISANINLQRELTGRFVHWSSRAYRTAKGHGEKPELTRRIYLNPKVSESVSIFGEVVDAAEAAGLRVKGKILDRSSEALSGWDRDEQGNLERVRADGIVLYATDQEADTLLGIAEEVYTKRFDAFRGRKTPRIPLRLGEGIAVGDEPGGAGESLTSHRAQVITKAIDLTRSRLGIRFGETIPSEHAARAVQAFHAVWDQVAAQEGVNPRNVAFNKR